jgi:hypothetical protein
MRSPSSRMVTILPVRQVLTWNACLAILMSPSRLTKRRASTACPAGRPQPVPRRRRGVGRDLPDEQQLNRIALRRGGRIAGLRERARLPGPAVQGPVLL